MKLRSHVSFKDTRNVIGSLSPKSVFPSPQYVVAPLDTQLKTVTSVPCPAAPPANPRPAGVCSVTHSVRRVMGGGIALPTMGSA